VEFGPHPRSGTSRLLGNILIAGVLAMLVVGAAYEAAVAAGGVAVGPRPGQMPAADTPIVVGAIWALAGAGTVLLAGCLSRTARDALATRLLALLNAAAICFVVARYYSYDPYYAPDLLRMSQGGIVPGWWMVSLVALAAGAIATLRRDTRVGMLLTAAVTWLAAITALAAGLGH
jgi:hypothetical protein